jgi:HlyD family secretion protein
MTPPMNLGKSAPPDTLADDPVALETAVPPEVRVYPPADQPRATRAPAPISASANASPELRDRVKKLRIGGGGSGGGGKGSFLGRTIWLPWALCALLAVTWGAVAIRTYRNPPKGDDGGGAVVTDSSGGSSGSGATTGGGNSSVPVPTGTIRWEGKGVLVVSRQISVSPIDVGGKVLELRGPRHPLDTAGGQSVIGGPLTAAQPPRKFEEGALYREGDIIAILDSTTYQAQVNEAKAGLTSAEQRLEAAVQRREAQLPSSVRKVEVEQVEAQLKEAQANKLQADQELARQERLGPAASLRELQQAQANATGLSARVKNLEATLVLLKQGPRKETLAAFEADVKSAEADVAASSARLVQAQWRLDNCTIKAPISGTVLTKSAEVGKLVNPMAFSGGGAICDLADLADLEADLKVAEREISKVRVGMRCTIRPDAYQDRVYAGTVHRIMPIANRADNTVNVRVRVKLFDGEIPGTFLKPEMGAVVSIRE